MSLKKFVLAFGLILALTVSGAAQEDMPPVIGEDTQGVLDVVQSYLNEPNADLLAEDATLYTPYQQTPVMGTEAVYDYDSDFYYTVFNEVNIEPMRYVVAENTVVAEYNFSGVHTGRYRDADPTSANVAFPAIAIFTVENDQITSIRRYYDATVLYSQMGYYGYTPAAPAAPAPVADADAEVDEILENLDVYRNDQVSVEGTIGEMVTDRAFILWDRDLIDLDGQERMLVILQSDDINFFPIDGGVAQVTGQVQDFVMKDIQARVDYDLDEAVFGDYTDLVVMVAESALNIGEAQEVEKIAESPEAFAGKQVTVEDSVGEMVGENAFILYDDELIGVGGRVLVIGRHEGMLNNLVPQEGTARVTGTVQDFDLTVLEKDVGYDLGDENLFVEYEDLPVIVARDVTHTDD